MKKITKLFTILSLTLGGMNLLAQPACTLYVTYTAPGPNQCNGTASVISPSFMCGAITYTWSNGATSSSIGGLCAGSSYTVVAASSMPGVNCCSLAVGVVNIPTVTPCNVTGGFTYSQNMSFFNFTNTSTGASSYQWNFGDGGIAGGANPTHNYASTGTYTVTMIASGGGNTVIPGFCADTVVQVVNVSTVCVADASFSMTPTGTPQYWNAFPLFPSNVTNATWSWGDGGVSNTLYTTHTYSAAGIYTICLSVTVSCGATDTYCTFYNIYRSSEDQNIITVNVINPLTLGIDNQSFGGNLEYNVYPNPNNGNFNLNINGLQPGAVKVSVYNVVGELVYSADNETSKGSLSKDIQLSGASSGVYFIQVNSNNHVFTKKVVVTSNN
jgi:PKD repeat protein